MQRCTPFPNQKLHKKVLAENRGLDDMIKMGLALDYTTTKSDQLDKGREDNAVCRMIKQEVNRLNNLSSTKSGQSNKL